MLSLFQRGHREARTQPGGTEAGVNANLACCSDPGGHARPRQAASHQEAHYFPFRCSIWKRHQQVTTADLTDTTSVTTRGVSPAKMVFTENSTEYLLWNHRSPAASQVCSPGLHTQMPEESSRIGPAASQTWLLHLTGSHTPEERDHESSMMRAVGQGIPGKF